MSPQQMQQMMANMPKNMSPDMMSNAMAQMQNMQPSDWDAAKKQIENMSPDDISRQAAASSNQASAQQQYTMTVGHKQPRNLTHVVLMSMGIASNKTSR